jgi:ABC-2 type transport system ATP-binding protein
MCEKREEKSLIEVKNLTKRYGDHYAIEDLSFKVEDGQVYGFLGPNGAGKSTTMNIMTGYLAPTAGEVLINGHDIMDEPLEAKKTIGYLPEIPPVYPDMTVREYLQFCAELKKVPKKERAAEVQKVMKELEISDMSERLIRNLSKGYRQRVGFAQALIGNPETLILDEPTVGLDPKQILEMLELIRSLGKKHTVILSSHILSEVSEVCDQVLIINHGKFVACDTPENLEKSRDNGTVLTVSSEGDRETVLKALRTVVQVTEKDLAEKDGVVTANIEVPEGSDIRKRVSEALFAANCTVIGMSTKKANLEDIFLKLTELDDQERARQKEEAEKAAEADKKDKEAEKTDTADSEAEKPEEAAKEPEKESNHEETDEKSETSDAGQDEEVKKS